VCLLPGDIPFSLNDLPWGMHRVKWDSGPVGSTDRVIFWGVQGSRMVEPRYCPTVCLSRRDDPTPLGTGASPLLCAQRCRQWSHWSFASVRPFCYLEPPRISRDQSNRLVLNRREGVMLQYQGAWDHLDGKGKRSGNTDVSQAFNSSLAVTSKSRGTPPNLLVRMDHS
jgi:hypothetical protein